MSLDARQKVFCAVDCGTMVAIVETVYTLGSPSLGERHDISGGRVEASLRAINEI